MGMVYSAAVDIWSLGVINREMLTGNRLYDLPLVFDDSPLLYAMRMGGVITPENWPGCEKTAWAPAPESFQTFLELTDLWGCSLPGECTDLARGLLKLRPDERWSLTAALSALEAVRDADAHERPTKRRCNVKLSPDTPLLGRALRMRAHACTMHAG